jgi:hypothetical protein
MPTNESSFTLQEIHQGIDSGETEPRAATASILNFTELLGPLWGTNYAVFSTPCSLMKPVHHRNWEQNTYTGRPSFDNAPEFRL